MSNKKYKSVPISVTSRKL